MMGLPLFAALGVAHIWHRLYPEPSYTEWFIAACVAGAMKTQLKATHDTAAVVEALERWAARLCP